MQIVIAGKAHPKDHPGKMLIREIVQLSRDPDLGKRIVFVEDYGMKVARELVQGVDLWLNNPRRGEEACGTSGMKAGSTALNSASWTAGSTRPTSIPAAGLSATASRTRRIRTKSTPAPIYSLLENEIVPMYYRGARKSARGVDPARQEVADVPEPAFQCQRMVGEYMSQLYEPAHRGFESVRRDGFSMARQRAKWNEQVNRSWGDVRFVDPGSGPADAIVSGSAVSFARRSGPCRIEAGRRARGGCHRARECDRRFGADTGFDSACGAARGSVVLFEREFVPYETGRLGYSLRVSPNHYDDPLTRAATHH